MSPFGMTEPEWAVLKTPFKVGTILRSTFREPQMAGRERKLTLVRVRGDHNLLGITLKVTRNVFTV